MLIEFDKLGHTCSLAWEKRIFCEKKKINVEISY